jgi:pilus assembly protein CpaE
MVERAGKGAQSQARTTAPSAMVFVQDRDSEGIIRQSLSNLGVADAELNIGDIGTAIATLAQAPSPTLLIVDVGGVDNPVSRVNELADVCEPNTGVVVIGDRNDIVLYRDLKHAGVVEYLFKPLVSDLVTRTCNSVLSGGTEPSGTRTGKLVFILGVRGGVGATTIAVNTAWYLAETRQRWVLLLDLDTRNGDAALQLDTAPSHALREALEHPERVDKLFLERAVIHVNQRIDLLASLEALDDPIDFEEDAILSLLDNVLHRYRFVFVDISETTPLLNKALHLPSICVLVSNGTLASARETARWRAYIGPNSPERTTLHLLNQHGAPGCLSDAEFTRAAGQPPDIIVPFDREIAIASILGTNGTQKSAALRHGLAPLLRQLSGEQVESTRSLFTRLFR